MADIPVAEMPMRHGMQHIVFRPFGETRDPLHLADIQLVLKEGPFWEAGDLFLSLRHPAMILLYRPSSDEIVRYEHRPLMAQHDVEILDDHRISIFDNRAYHCGEAGLVDGASNVGALSAATDAPGCPRAGI